MTLTALGREGLRTGVRASGTGHVTDRGFAWWVEILKLLLSTFSSSAQTQSLHLIFAFCIFLHYDREPMLSSRKVCAFIFTTH